SAAELGALDAAAIARVRDEAWPQVDSADELHDALLTCGFLTEAEGEAGREGVSWRGYFAELVEAGRALAIRGSGPGRGSAAAEPPLGRGSDMPATISGTGTGTGTKSSAPDAAGFPAVWAATERLGEVRAVWPEAVLQGSDATLSLSAAAWERADAIRELLRGRLEVLGPTPAAELAESLGVEEGEAEAALVALEAEGVVLRGSFTPGTTQREWCERRLLARIHRYTLNRLRAEIEPVSAADFMRFLVQWQRVEPGQRVSGLDGLSAVLEQLNGFELPAAAWEADLLPSRCENYTPELLDALCLMGRVAWGRLSPPAPAATEAAAGGGPASLGLAADGARAGGGPRRLRRAPGPLRTSPIALFTRRNAAAWLEVARPGHLSTYASQVMEALERRGASFFEELASESGLLPTQVELALAELAALGLVTSDSFAGLRALLTPPDRRRPVGGARARRSVSPYGVETAGRWSLLASRTDAAAGADNGRRWGAAAVELAARTLLRRYGIVFRRLLVREATAPPWRELVLSYRRLEARGEIRGGRFLAGISGEQFALPEAVGSLRAVRKQRPDGRLLAISAADPLNLVGILTPGERVPALAGNRILFRDGVPIAVREAGTSRRLTPDPTLTDRDLEHAIARRGVSPLLRAYLRPAG
ncbi:MAG: ATP-dependent DNA helicase, partial [Gemmatimonadetes bacterium]|nr:ATP-dependent DNA helicase [Gemmatimonadota bacterium]